MRGPIIARACRLSAIQSTSAVAARLNQVSAYSRCFAMPASGCSRTATRPGVETSCSTTTGSTSSPVRSRKRSMERFCHTLPSTTSPESSRKRAGGRVAKPLTSTCPAGTATSGGARVGRPARDPAPVHQHRGGTRVKAQRRHHEVAGAPLADLVVHEDLALGDPLAARVHVPVHERLGRGHGARQAQRRLVHARLEQRLAPGLLARRGPPASGPARA